MNTPTQLVTYNVSEQVIAELQSKANILEIKSIDDRENYNLVDSTRKEAKRLKIEIENRRKELKADALAFGRLVDSEAARFSKPLEEIEDILTAKQKKIDDEKARIKLEKEQLEKLPNRKLLLAEFESMPSDEEIKVLSDIDFQELIQKLVADRQAKIQAEQEKERLRLIQEKIELEQKLEAERMKIKADQDKLLEAERAKQREMDRIENEKKEAERKKEEDRLRAERQKLDEERKAFELEQEIKKQKELQAEQEKAELSKKENENRILVWKKNNGYNPTTDLIQPTQKGFALYRFISEIKSLKDE